jgi:hypothetical protein
MPNDTPENPFEGKGEEMVPDRGLPFDDIEETEEEETLPEEITAGEGEPTSEGETRDSLEEGQPSIEAESQPETGEEATESTDIDESEALSDSQAGESLEPDSEAFFDFPEEEQEALVGDAATNFATEATPWEMTEEEAEVLAGDAADAFTFEEQPEEAPEAVPPEGPMPPGIEDGGMSTHREDKPEEIAAFFSEAAFEAPGPSIPAGLFKPDEGPEPEASEEMLKLLVKDDDMADLWKRANQAQKDINVHITTLYIAQPLLDRIQKARELLMAGKVNYEDAERHINQVEYRVQLSLQLDAWGKSLIRNLFIYLGLCFVILIVLLMTLANRLFNNQSTHLFYLAGSMIWGGIGGVIGALLPLIRHFSEEQDFSKQHTWWYIASPLMGVALGAIIYLFVSAGALSITSGGEISSPMIIYILAGLSGYQQNIFTDLVKRMLKALELGGEEEEEGQESNKEG